MGPEGNVTDTRSCSPLSPRRRSGTTKLPKQRSLWRFRTHTATKMVLLAPTAWREFPPSVYAASTARTDASAEPPHTLRGSASLPAIGSGSMLGGTHMRRRRQRLADPSRPSKAAMARARRHVWKNEVRVCTLDAFCMQCLLHTASTRTSSTYGHVMCMRMHGHLHVHNVTCRAQLGAHM